jgi:hypothetical protein
MTVRNILKTVFATALCMSSLAGFVHGASARLEPGQAEVILKVENMT